MNDLVELDSSEMMIGALAGVMRQVENIKLGRAPGNNLEEGQDWQINIEGSMGEQAFAKYRKIYWAGKGKFREPDVGEYEVRTASRQTDRLIIKKHDPEDRVYWLLCGSNGVYRVKGWIFGHEGKLKEYWDDPTGKNRPAFFVPQHALYKPELIYLANPNQQKEQA